MTDNPAKPPTEADSPEVLTFPPVIYATFFIIGVITDRALSHSMEFYGIPHRAGWALAIIGVLIVGWAIARFVIEKTHVDVRKPATTLVSDGPYQFSRNPMYLAATLLYAGVAIAYGKTATLALLIPCMIVMHYGVITREERYLEGKFGDAYRDYRAKVRRWL
jgi:protein-S-isoprenylcysteine O-methyltransferase Ste14